LFVALSALALAAAGCSVFRGGGGTSDPSITASTAEGDRTTDTVDVRQFLGPDYCPELRVLDGAELMRRYESGNADDPAYVVWQASFGDTARECLYDGQGTLTLKIGVAGRVIAGPKGGAASVDVPLKIAVVKFKEAVLFTQGYTLAVSMPATGSATFAEVYEITVPSPGNDRDYIVYVGFDVGGWDPMNPGAAVAAVEEPAPLPPPPPPQPTQPPPAPPPPPQPSQPSVLPVPSGGFILSR
jgi:hypothetical protein